MYGWEQDFFDKRGRGKKVINDDQLELDKALKQEKYHIIQK